MKLLSSWVLLTIVLFCVSVELKNVVGFGNSIYDVCMSLLLSCKHGEYGIEERVGLGEFSPNDSSPS